jgi:predicted amidophosphoribosyltransferase
MMSPRKSVAKAKSNKISDYVDPDIALGVAIICPHCNRKVGNVRFCWNCGERLHPNTWVQH